MARIEWVKSRLNNWAMWKARDAGSGRGFAGECPTFSEAGGGGYREAVIPVLDVDAGVTDLAVQALAESHPHLHRTVINIYLDDLGIVGTANLQGKAQSTISGHLDLADHALSAWFGGRAAAKKSFTT